MLHNNNNYNYRGISLSSIFVKLFDLLVLTRYGDCLRASDQQIGFRASRSTDMRSMVLKESIYCYAKMVAQSC